MTELDDQRRPEPPLSADETVTLLDFLDYQRATLEWKCSGLEAAGLRVTVGASTMTLGGLLKHLAFAEDWWFSRGLHGHAPAPPWNTVDWAGDNDWDWNSAADDTPERLLSLWRDAVARSRSLTAEALAQGGLDRLARRPQPTVEPPAFDGSCATSLRSTRATTAMRISSASRSTGSPACDGTRAGAKPRPTGSRSRWSGPRTTTWSTYVRNKWSVAGASVTHAALRSGPPRRHARPDDGCWREFSDH